MILFEKIIEFLDQNQVEYQLLSHEPVWTSKQAARVRPDISLKQGAKAMVLRVLGSEFRAQGSKEIISHDPRPKAQNSFVMVVLPGDQRIDYKKVSKFLGVKDCTLAGPEEVEKAVGVKIGAVSPLGLLSSLKTLVERSLLGNEKIAFNAGDHARTVIMKSDDYLKISGAEVGDFAKV